MRGIMAKICLIASSVFTYGGEQRVTAVIANELAKNNRIVLYTMDGEADIEANPYGLTGEIEIRCTKQPKFGMINRVLRRLIRELNEKTGLFYRKRSCYGILEYAYFPKAWQKQLLSELNREPYDVILAVSGGNSMRLGLIADGLSCRTAGWEHNAYEAYFETPGLYFWHMDLLFQKAVNSLDHCIVLNDYIRQRYKEAFGADCDVIYNPRSFVSAEKSALKNKTFVACGRMIRQKGFDLLIEAFAGFAARDSEWNLVIVGDGEMRGQIEEAVRSYGLSERVVITGFTNEVKRYLLEASVYLLSSRWEGFPMVLTEAFEMGLPTVAFDITAVTPLLTDGEEGLLARPFDTEDFAKRMYEITRLPQKDLEEMAQKAVRKAESLAVERIITAWKELLGAD